MGRRETRHNAALERIRTNIERHGHHVYVVAAREAPRFAYTIGLSGVAGVELVLAGGAYFDDDAVVEILNACAARLRADRSCRSVTIDGAGSFELGDVHSSWTKHLALGARDYYGREVEAVQIVPEPRTWTGDTPDLSRARSTEHDRAWRWLDETWAWPVPEESTAVTDLDALRGAPIVEAARWETSQWELFSVPGDAIDRERIRLVPIGTMIALDGSLEPLLHLRTGDGLVRDDGASAWLVWE